MMYLWIVDVFDVYKKSWFSKTRQRYVSHGDPFVDRQGRAFYPGGVPGAHPTIPTWGQRSFGGLQDQFATWYRDIGSRMPGLSTLSGAGLAAAYGAYMAGGDPLRAGVGAVVPAGALPAYDAWMRFNPLGIGM